MSRCGRNVERSRGRKPSDEIDNLVNRSIPDAGSIRRSWPSRGESVAVERLPQLFYCASLDLAYPLWAHAQ